MDRHLVILGIRGVPATHGGFESFAEKLAPWMARSGWKVTVYCQGSETGRRYEDDWEGCRRIHIPVKRSGPLGTVEFDIKSNFDALMQNAVFLTLGYNTGFLSVIVRMKRNLNVINMDGIEWKRDKYSWPEQVYLWLNERMAALSGNVLVADHPEIASHHAEHAAKSKIVMIPYGSDQVQAADENRIVERGLVPGRFLTVIARPEPENSLLEIVQAFSRRERGVKLVVLGNYKRDNSYHAKVLEAASDEVVFPGAIYEKEVLHALRLYSMAYVHGHRVGGTNPSLVEALGAGNAVIAHDNKFNRWVAGKAGVYFADEHALDQVFSEILASPEALNELRAQARLRWEEDFTWPSILGQYQALLTKVCDPA